VVVEILIDGAPPNNPFESAPIKGRLARSSTIIRPLVSLSVGVRWRAGTVPGGTDGSANIN
jgi:hypothetical protein